MAEKNIGKITQIIGAVLDIKFQNEMLPEINSAINITRSNGERLVVEVADRKSTRLNSSHNRESRMPSSA